ncbi:MAG: histidine kinase dimerization/phosphoacceptor domain -containing protein [Gracilimonas sp.]
MIFFYIASSVKNSGIVISKPDKNKTTIDARVSGRKDTLLHFIEGITRTFELKKLLASSMEATKLIMNAEASSLMLLDELTGDLNVSIPTGPVKDKIKGMTVPKNKGIGGWVISYNQPFISNDVTESDVFWKDLSDDFTTRNIICVPLQDEQGDAFGVLQAINKKDGKPFVNEDVAVFETLALHVSGAIERSKEYEKMKDLLDKREIQIAEIHHRLRNNLSTISALLEFDLREITEPKAQQAIIAANSRLKSVAIAHSLLYDQKQIDRVMLSDYLESVIHNVENVFKDPDKDIFIQSDIEEMYLDAKRAMLCGMIVNELLINAYKHAFEGRGQGEIVITLKKTPRDQIALIVADNGIGIQDQDIKSSGKPSGQFVLKALAKKLKAEINFEENPKIGTACVIKFPV